jgi:hypothetical protein
MSLKNSSEPPSTARVKERVELYLYSPSGPSWPVLGRTYLYLFTYEDFVREVVRFRMESYMCWYQVFST